MTENVGMLHWPLGWPRTADDRRLRSSFSQTRSYYESTRRVMGEVRRLGGKDLVVSSNLRLRSDGLPYADQRRPADPGVAIYFQLEGKPVAFACDRYIRPEDNLYAVAVTIEAKRGVLRWGCATGQREFTGYNALPETVELGRAAYDPPLHEVLGVSARATPDEFRRAWREWLKAGHPDQGGDSDRFVRIKAQYESLMGARV